MAEAKGAKASDTGILEEALEAFDEAVENESDDRREALDDLRFSRLGEQWPEKIKAARDQAARPCLTINKMPAFRRQVVNEARQNRPSIKVRPADSAGDPATAQVMNGLIRNIEQTSNAEAAYDTAIESAVDLGFGYWRVALKYAHDDAFDLDLAIERIANPFTVYRDPRSTAVDSSDWNRAFITELIPRKSFEVLYKDAEASDWQADYDGLQEQWRNGDEIRIAEYWKRTEVEGMLLKLSNEAIVDADQYTKNRAAFDAAGITVVGSRDTRRHKVMQYILSGAEVLSSTEWQGKYIPIVPVYGDEVNVEGKRVLRSMIRDAKDAQRMFNYWRTTSTENVALQSKAPYIGPKGFAKSSQGKWATANVENHPYLEYDPIAGQPPPVRQPFQGPDIASMQEAMNASDDMKAILGMYDASLGNRSNETSGVAITARQREGDVSNFHFTDNQSRAIRHTGRILLDLIPKVYTGPRIVRILGPDGNAQTVPVNQPAPQPDGQVRIFDLTAGKYDLTVEAGPSYATKRQEAAEQMVELMKAYPAITPLIGDLLVKNLDWPGAEEISDRLKAMLPPQLQGQDPRMQAMQQQMQMMDQQAKQAVAQLQGDLQKCQQQLLEAKTKEEAAALDKQIQQQQNDIKFYEAVTKRMTAGLDLVEGAVADPQMLAMLGEAQGQMGNVQMQRQAVEQQKAMEIQQQREAALAAVASLSQAIEKLAAPRMVQRDQNNLVTVH